MWKKMSIWWAILGLVLTMVAFVSGAWGMAHTMKSLMEERDDRLFDLVASIDHALSSAVHDLQWELEGELEKHRVVEAEETWKRTGSAEPLKECAHLFMSLHENQLIYIVAMDGERQVFCSECENTCSFQMFEKGLQDDEVSRPKRPELVVCREDDDNYYLAVRVASKNSNLVYYAMMDSQVLYRDLVPRTLYDDNWVVLYDMESGLALQNHREQPAYDVMTPEEIRARGDGYTLLLDAEMSQEQQKMVYEYERFEGDVAQQHMVAVPSILTENSYLAIGVAHDSRDLAYKSSFFHLQGIILVLVFTGALLMVGVGFLAIRARMIANEELLAITQEEAKMKEQLQEAQVRNSMAQLQPHFLYNALASIREVVLVDPEYGQRLIYDFTVHLRACLKAAAGGGLISFASEMENVKSYVEIERMRFGDRVTYEQDLQATDFEIVPLTIQPLVENAIRHGITEARKRHGKVMVHSWREEGWICISVEDDGQGFDVKAWERSVERPDSDSIGLKSVLMSLRNKMGADVEILSVIDEGTKIMIRIPEPKADVVS